MTNREELLHYCWKFKLFAAENLITTDEQKLEIIDPGTWNNNAGPDFFNAKIKIGETVWAGNVEIHRSSDEWMKHGHHTDKAYNSVVLHVVEYDKGDVFNEKGQKVPQLVIHVSEKVKQNADFLLFSDAILPCKSHLANTPKQLTDAWLTTLAIERLERKTDDVFAHLKRFNNSWDDTFYVLLARNFGFGLNSDEFERLALSLPYSYIRKHSDNLFQVEALLFGQAGMLEENEAKDDYYFELQREYQFLKKKFMLKPLEDVHFKKLRTRPQGFPQVRIAELAAVIQQSDRLFSAILEKEDPLQLRMFFQINASQYWQTHYSFGKTSKKLSKSLGDNSLDTILINSVVPLLFAYGKQNTIEKYTDRAIHILEALKPERNSIVRDFRAAGIEMKNAFDTQASIQLYREYCQKRKCLYCRFGHRILSNGFHYFSDSSMLNL
ncbi:DUF2851 domain-containing protein [Dysgonamonadaceae bacterium]|nr:DUF2851 domain-containing protein [Dysgonamonadaceae bacterium]